MQINEILTQDGLFNKIQYQRQLKQEFPNDYHIEMGGRVSYVGEIPKGCYECITNRTRTYCGGVTLNSSVKNYCNADCPYCFYDKGDGNGMTRCVTSKQPDVSQAINDIDELCKNVDAIKEMYEIQDNYQNFLFPIYNFTGFACEPLLYIDAIEKLMKFYTGSVEPILNNVSSDVGCFKLYTNGLLLDSTMCERLKVCGFNEIRVNVAAHCFNEGVYQNIIGACDIFDNVYIEVPVYPNYKDFLFDMVCRGDDLGIKGINLCQMKFDKASVLHKTQNLLPAYSFYRGTPTYYMLDDMGLTEDLIRAALSMNCKFSILDCNVFTMGGMTSSVEFNNN